MNTMINTSDTTVITASGNPLMGSPLGIDRYRTGVTLPASLGAVCLQAAPPALEAAWDSFAGTDRLSDERPNSDVSKPRHGSMASDGSG